MVSHLPPGGSNASPEPGDTSRSWRLCLEKVGQVSLTYVSFCFLFLLFSLSSFLLLFFFPMELRLTSNSPSTCFSFPSAGRAQLTCLAFLT